MMRKTIKLSCYFMTLCIFASLQACGSVAKHAELPENDPIQNAEITESRGESDHQQKAENPYQNSNKSEGAMTSSIDRKAAVGAPAMELLVIARDQAAHGYGELASSTLERAISIEPENPWLWHRLAVLRMQLKHWSQSVELANRSIALAKGDQRLIGGNWLVISLALEGAGDIKGAQKAKRHSDIYLGKESE